MDRRTDISTHRSFSLALSLSLSLRLSPPPTHLAHTHLHIQHAYKGIWNKDLPHEYRYNIF